MTENTATPFFSAAMRCRRLAADIGCLFHRALKAYETRRALTDLPDNLLRDVGLHRSEINSTADSIASEKGDPTRDPRDHLNRSAAHLQAARRRASGLLPQAAVRIFTTLVIAGSMLAGFSNGSQGQTAQVKRGEYLVTLGGCNDCHTPGYFFGRPDKTRLLGGSEVGFAIPDLGVFHGPNLTPDQETGLGTWSSDEIVAAITRASGPTGVSLRRSCPGAPSPA